MLAGFGEVVITPPLDTEMAGYFERRLAEGIRDHLYSRALVVSAGDRHIALVVTDLIHVNHDDVNRVRERIFARTGIPPNHVIVQATHTHTGPVVTKDGSFEPDPDYLRTWAKITAGAVEIAFRNSVEVTMGGGKGTLPGVSFNRRFRMANGYVHTNPGVGNPEIVEPAGPVDPEVTVLRFDGPDGNPVGILTHFTCHTDTLGGTLLSGDWVGVTAQRLRDLLAPQCGTLGRDLGVIVMNGACGDINHIDVNDPDRKRRWPEVTEAIGIGLAAETARVATGIRTEQTDEVDAASSRLVLQRIPAESFLKGSQQAIDDPGVGRMERKRAEANLERADEIRMASDEVEAEVTCLRIGPAVIASCPGELSCELGLAFKQAVPAAYPMVANLSNGHLGYLPAARAYTEGGYENRSARMQPGTAEQIVEQVITLARSLV